MHEINPVLAGTFDAPDYAPSNNFASGTNSGTNSTTGTDQVSGPDDRRYTKFDRSDTEAGTATMSFSDLVDMFNPLEHIPVVSSVYRAITGEEINPVSRVAGDILYGGAFGAASAVLGGVSAIADAGLEQETGKDSGGIAIAALFGPDDNNPVQVADAGTKTNVAVADATSSTPANAAAPVTVPTTQSIELAQSTTSTPLLAALDIPVPAPPPRSADTSAPDVVAPNGQSTSAQTVNAAAAPTASTPSGNTPASNPSLVISQNTAPAPGISLTSAGPAEQAAGGLIPLANPQSSSSTGKRAFGGVIGMPNMQAQQMALALSQGQPSMRIGSRVYTNGLLNGSHPGALSTDNAQAKLAPVVAPAPVLPASFAPPQAASNPAVSSLTGKVSPQAAINALTSPNQSPMSSALMQDMMMKALSQYGTVAAGPSFGNNSQVNFLN